MANYKEKYAQFRIKEPLEKSKLPKPIFEKNKKFEKLYWVAWELAWDHVLQRNDTPQERYIDEAMDPDQIWIWDSCFMALFCRYGYKTFPGIETLDNFYAILYDNYESPVKIHFADNPPLFAWIEHEYLKFTGDVERIKKILNKKNYLQQHFTFIDNARNQRKKRNVMVRHKARKERLGYRWQGNTSGMDNTPRGRTWWNNTRMNLRGQIVDNNIYWVDLLAQQALSAKYIEKLQKIIGNPSEAEKYRKKWMYLCKLLNRWYWDPNDGFYYDIKRKEAKNHLKNYSSRENQHEEDTEIFNKVKSIASYWPLLAECSNATQAESMANYAKNPDYFGGIIPFPSLSRSDPEFVPQGRYWRGGVWLPTTYMATKALEKYGFIDLANDYAHRLLIAMLRTLEQFSLSTIWETYSPTEFQPSTQKRNKDYVREDFCGWSALGPIYLFIENILGFQEVNCLNEKIVWNIHHDCKHGIRNLCFGQFMADLIYPEGTLDIHTNKEFEVEVNLDKSIFGDLEIIQNRFHITKGHHEIDLL